MQLETPLTRIGAGERLLISRMQEIWRYRELLFLLAWRDVQVRYRQTLLGVAWAALQPLLLMLMFTIFFGKLAGIATDGAPYALFAFVGLLPWIFFSHAVTESGNSLVANPDLITKVYLPRVLVPAAAIVASLVDFAISFVLLIGLMAYFGVGVTSALLMLPLLTLHLAVLALAVGLWMAALNVRYRDVRHALPFAIQLWLFASPVIYPSTLVPAEWRPLLLLNPLTGIIEGFRSALLNRPFDWVAISASMILTLLALLYALHYFRCVEKSFADII